MHGTTGRLVRVMLKEIGNEVSATSFEELGRSVWPSGLGVLRDKVYVSEILGTIKKFSNASVVPVTLIQHEFLGNGPLVADAASGAFLSSGL